MSRRRDCRWRGACGSALSLCPPSPDHRRPGGLNDFSILGFVAEQHVKSAEFVGVPTVEFCAGADLRSRLSLDLDVLLPEELVLRWVRGGAPTSELRRENLRELVTRLQATGGGALRVTRVAAQR